MRGESTVCVSTEIELGDIIYGICKLDRDEIAKIFRRIDLIKADWEFTNNMYQWYKEQHEEYLKGEEENEEQ